jgi:hypothetical protein
MRVVPVCILVSLTKWFLSTPIPKQGALVEVSYQPLWECLFTDEGYGMTDENTTITHYEVSLTIPDDETTEVIIKTKSAGVAFATSPEDALNQTKTANEYSQQSYASYILRYVRDNLLTIDVNDVTLTYTQDPTINPMTDDDLQGFQRDVVSANG